MKVFFLSLFTAVSVLAGAQQNVGIGTTTPNSNAILDVTSSTKGMLMPGLNTAQRKAIVNPPFGLMVFDTDKGTILFYDGTAWRALSFTDEDKTAPQSRSSTQPITSAGVGTRVSISGSYAIAGAPNYAGSGFNKGIAYIFTKTLSGWRQTAILAPSDSAD